MIGYPRRKDREIMPTRDSCLFCSYNNILPKSKQVHESFLLQNMDWTRKWENWKTPSLLHITGFLLMFKNKQEQKSFFQCSLCHIINLLLTKLVRSWWLAIGLIRKRGTWPTSSHLDLTCLVNNMYFIPTSASFLRDFLKVVYIPRKLSLAKQEILHDPA